MITAVLATAVALRLLAGPIDLDFLRTRLGQEFDTPGGKVKIHADRVSVEWSSLRQPMRLVLSGLRVTNDADQVVATAPSVALSFEPRSAIRGRLLPTAIVVDQPTLDADIAREGGMLRRVLAKTDTETTGEVVDLLIDQLLAEPNHTSLLGQLDTVQVEHAKVTLRDVPSGVLWIAPNVQARLKRDAAGVIISASAQFLSSTSPIDVALSGSYSRDRSRVSIEAKIDGLKPSMLADLSPDATILRGIDIALSGRMSIEASGTGEIRTVAIDVTGGDGRLTLPGILPVSHKVRSVAAHATIDAAILPPRSIMDVDVGAAKVRVTGIGLRTEQGGVYRRADISRSVDHLGDYWPEFAPGGRWAMAIANGTRRGVGQPQRRATISRSSGRPQRGLARFPSMTVHCGTCQAPAGLSRRASKRHAAFRRGGQLRSTSPWQAPPSTSPISTARCLTCADPHDRRHRASSGRPAGAPCSNRATCYD